MQWYYWYGYESTTQDALLYYTTLPGVTASVANEIRNRKQSSMNGSEFLGAFTNKTDAYRAFLKDEDYVWGNNQTKAHIGIIFRQQLVYGLDPINASNYRAAAGGYLHYFHGVNPLSMTFLTNMYAHGGDNCANEIYHSWFGDGTSWDSAIVSPFKGPPPAYIPGGANPHWQPDPA
ncbi:MAG TPA: glycoside hydrolase family 9 protein, partial [Roseimicrobium sp.]|nr:glycoside hydrolase family 9 protein [Roseimicrobium sp.]